jgi:hypothetical protein
MSKRAERFASQSVSRSEAGRLGRPGSYRLGGPGPGNWPVRPPEPFRASFERPQHRGAAVAWLLAAVTATAAIAATAIAGWWFMPFVLGVMTGVVTAWGCWRLRVAVPAIALMTMGGWGLALWVTALRGAPVGATSRVIAVMSGLPALGVITVAIALAVSGALGLVGLWLGRAVAPRFRPD